MINPNDIARDNGNFLGLPYTLETTKIVFFPVPWDVTTSYQPGSSQGPSSILQASLQLECYDFHVKKAWEIGHFFLPINSKILERNNHYRKIAEEVIDYQTQGGSAQDPQIKAQLNQVNQASEELNQWVYSQTQQLLQQNKLIGLVGGDHSVSLGLMQALSEKYSSYGILHIDAHGDLRNAYEGFTYSHASIMYNAQKINKISHFIQVGIRDICEEELKLIQTDKRFVLFDDWQLKNNQYQGITWAKQCEEIIQHLPNKVYISFDIDGLSPEFCPHTGTPVPGGLSFNQSIYLIEKLVQSGRQIIGFDLCEVAPGHNEWDGNVAARLLYKLANFMFASFPL